MKHPLSTTLVLLALFVAAQLIGVSLLSMNISGVETVDGVTTVEHGTTAVGDRPDLSGGQSLLFIAVGVAVGTIAVLLLIRLRAFKLWKAWFLLAVFLALSVAFGVLLPTWAAFTLAAALAIWKVFRPGPIIHNLTELFLYGGIAVLLSPLFDLRWAVALLILISAYDAYAVWQSKHMVAMAQAQTRSDMFAGLYVPRAKEKTIPVERKATKTAARSAKAIKPSRTDIPPPPQPSGSTHAILGGGDIAFPLIFSGAVLTWLIETRSILPKDALLLTTIVTATTTLALATLFWRAKKGKFYPAMPFLTIGCLAGLGIIWVATL